MPNGVDAAAAGDALPRDERVIRVGTETLTLIGVDGSRFCLKLVDQTLIVLADSGAPFIATALTEFREAPDGVARARLEAAGNVYVSRTTRRGRSRGERATQPL